MKYLKKHKIRVVIIALCVILGSAAAYFLYNMFKPTYQEEDFGFKRIYSSVDANHNGVDDYSDILKGALMDAKNHPTYDGRYWYSGYPPDNIGVCTDVIWRAFKQAGYNLRAMVDQDISKYNEEDYHLKKPDTNIDFRRVGNLYIFFMKYAEVLTTDVNQIEEWQPGDIVTFGTYKHIGIISDKRNDKGVPYLIHNSGQIDREEDVLERKEDSLEITGHFRWNAENLKDVIVYWEE